VAYLIRTNNVVLIAAIVTGLLAIGFNGDNLRRRSLKAALAFAGFVVAATPWFISNWQTKGSPTASQHHTQVAAHFFHPQGDDWAANSAEMGEQFHSLGEVLRHDPVRMIKTYVQDMSLRYPALLASLVVGFPAMVFAGAGLLLLFVRDLTRERLFYAIPLFFSYLVLGLVGFQSRFYLFLLPTIFAAVAYFAFEGKWGPQNSRRVSGVLAWSLVLATTAVLLYESRSKVILALRSQPVEILEAAKSLSGVERGLRLAGPPHLAYQLGWTTVRLRANTAEEYLARARREGIHYIMYTPQQEGGWPNAAVLRDPKLVPPGLNPVFVHRPSGAIVYKVEPQVDTTSREPGTSHGSQSSSAVERRTSEALNAYQRAVGLPPERGQQAGRSQ
jgi:hypothetical protein